jgi:ORF6N domain
MRTSLSLISLERIQKQIFLLCGRKVPLSQHLAALYGVPVRVLNQAVSRNRERFPDDFMFQLDRAELENLKSQIVTLSWGGARALPYAFTEEGVAMLSSVLRSGRAVQVNVAIMRAFVQLRQMLSGHAKLACNLAELEQRIAGHDTAIRSLFEAIRQLMAPPPAPPKPEIGFHVKEDAPPYRIKRKAER